MVYGTSPKVTVVLSELELHWLINRHNRNIEEGPAFNHIWGRDWSEDRKDALLISWDKTAK